MLKFVFLLTVWSSTGEPPRVYVQGVDLTGVQCIEMMSEYNRRSPGWGYGEPSCEIQVGSEH